MVVKENPDRKKNHEALITKINNRKHLHVEFKFLLANWWLYNGWTPIWHIFRHLYDQSGRFSKRFVDDIISKKKKDQPDLQFEKLNNHHPNIKYTTETMPQKFFDTNIIYEDNQIKEMKENFLSIGHQRFQNVTRGMLSMMI